MTTSLNKNYGLTLGLDIIHSIISSFNIFLIVLYTEQPLIDFRVIFSIRDIYALIYSPLLTKFRAALR